MKKYLFFLLGIINIHSAFSQATGYMGKRFLLESYNMTAVNWYMKALGGDNFLVAFSPGAQVEYALGRSSAVSATYNFSFHKEEVIFPTQRVTSVGIDGYEAEYFYEKVTGHSLGLNYRYYYTKKNEYWGIAPIGNYIGIGVGCYTGVSLNTKNSPIVYTSPKIDTKPFLRLEVGSRNIIFEHITLSYGICFTPLFRKYNQYGVDTGIGDLHSIPILDRYNKVNMDNSLKFANSFTANVGIGLFLF